MRLAVIIARGGSKRIPRKNVRLFAGRPIISFAIEAAKRSGLFERVIVSTEDDEVARIAADWGGEVPFRRPLHLADDHTPTVPVVAHAVDACEAMGWHVETACCIYPAVPFLDALDVAGALGLLESTGADYSFLIAEFSSKPQRALQRDSEGFLSPLFPEHELRRTQDLTSAYFDAGQLYWGTAQAWRSNLRIHQSGVGYQIPGWRAVDIDTEDDWVRAEQLYYTLNPKAP